VASLNRIILIGTLTKDPESRSSIDGTPMTKFNLAVNRFLGSKQSAVDFIDIVAWQRLAEISAQYLKKGSLVLIEGRIQVRSYEDQSGKRKWVTEVVANDLQMMPGKMQEPMVETAAEPVAIEEEVEELPEDDLPF